MFKRFKLVKNWHTPTEFSIRIYERRWLFFYTYIIGGFDSVEDAERRVNAIYESEAEQKAFIKSFPKNTVEKRL
jgi:hypothetical protein